MDKFRNLPKGTKIRIFTGIATGGVPVLTEYTIVSTLGQDQSETRYWALNDGIGMCRVVRSPEIREVVSKPSERFSPASKPHPNVPVYELGDEVILTLHDPYTRRVRGKVVAVNLYPDKPDAEYKVRTVEGETISHCTRFHLESAPNSSTADAVIRAASAYGSQPMKESAEAFLDFVDHDYKLPNWQRDWIKQLYNSRDELRDAFGVKPVDIYRHVKINPVLTAAYGEDNKEDNMKMIKLMPGYRTLMVRPCNGLDLRPTAERHPVACYNDNVAVGDFVILGVADADADSREKLCIALVVEPNAFEKFDIESHCHERIMREVIDRFDTSAYNDRRKALEKRLRLEDVSCDLHNELENLNLQCPDGKGLDPRTEQVLKAYNEAKDRADFTAGE